MNINEILKNQFNLRDEQVNNTIKLIDEGNTIPFIARYRKEMTGEMSDVTLREFYEKLKKKFASYIACLSYCYHNGSIFVMQYIWRRGRNSFRLSARADRGC